MTPGPSPAPRVSALGSPRRPPTLDTYPIFHHPPAIRRMSSAPIQPAPVDKTPFLAAAAVFIAVAALILALAIKPLGLAELIGLLACVSSASIFATIPFAIDHARRTEASRRAPSEPPHPAAGALDAEQLADRVATAVDARIASALPSLAAQITAELNAAEDRRRAELQTALAASAPARPVDADTVTAPTGAKPRLGRGLLGLMHAPGALAAKPAAAPSPDSPATGADAGGSEDDRAAA